jgi:replicative DNA helicase
MDNVTYNQTTDQEATSTFNIEAEQALIGLLLVNNEVLGEIETIIGEEHFYDGINKKIFSHIASRTRKGMIVSPITLKPYLDSDEDFKDIDVPSLLTELSAMAISAFAAKDYATSLFELAVRRKLVEIGSEIITDAKKVTEETIQSQLITKAEQSLYHVASIGTQSKNFEPLVKAATEAIELANRAFESDIQGVSGIPSGFIDIDKKLGGLQNSDLIILAGRPSMGKTALATNIAYNAAITNFKKFGTASSVGFFSLEMSSAQLATRILSDISKIPSEQIRRGELSENEFNQFVEAARSLDQSKFFIDDTPALLISSIASKARRLKRTHGLDFLIVDYLQLIRASSNKENRVNEVAEITQGLKAIAKELNIPVLALSQLSRQVENREDKRPQLADLRESGAIEQDADVVLFIFREEYYKEREKPGDQDLDALIKWQEEMDQIHGKAELIIGKQRHGPVGTVELAFDGRFTRFGNLAKNQQIRS